MAYLRTLIAIAMLSSLQALWAQDKPGGDPNADGIVQEPKDDGSGGKFGGGKGGGGKGEGGGGMVGDVKIVDGKVVKEAPPANHGARGFCRFDGSLTPKRLLPGQTGTVLVTMILEGDAVLPAAPNLQVKPANQPLQVGSWSIRPPSTATVAAAFKGQPAYDNWAVIEVPVTMPKTAVLGTTIHLALDVEFDLVNGTSAAPLGHFNERVSVVCPVGVVNDPVVAVTARGADRTGSDASTPSVPAAASPAADKQGTAQSGRPATPQPVAVLPSGTSDPAGAVERPGQPAGAENGPADAPALPGSGSSSNSLLIVGGAGLLLVAVIAVMIKRR